MHNLGYTDFNIYENINKVKVNYSNYLNNDSIQLINNFYNYDFILLNYMKKSTEKIGFIILRHVNNELTNNYWIECYDCIRKFYPENNILIIDDNSNYNYIKEKELYKTNIIKSEYHGRGELLPYYYYLHNKLFDVAVILHDSVFINKYINFDVNTYKMLWSFNSVVCPQIEDETIMIKSFNDSNLLNFYKKKELWKGCFGGMSIITHDYLTLINNKYPISNLLNFVLTRYNRCSLERVIACLLQINDMTWVFLGNENNKVSVPVKTPVRYGANGKYKFKIKSNSFIVNNKTFGDPIINIHKTVEYLHINEALLGNIHSYCKWEITYKDKDNYKHLPLTKIWTGR